MASERKNLAENTINACQIGNTEWISSISKRSQSKRAFNVSAMLSSVVRLINSPTTEALVLKGELQASVQNVRIELSPRVGSGSVENVVFLVTEMWLEASTCTPLHSKPR
jgi:hypothetical protein